MERAGIAQGDQIALIAHDSYYRDLGHIPDKEERAKVNFDHPDSLETELMIEHLQKLKNGEEVDVPVYSFDSHSRVSETTHISSGKRIIIVEGILIFSNLELVDMFDIKIFVDTADDIRFIRRLRRDIIDRERSITSVIDQYLNTVRPMHHQFVEHSKHHANIIIPYGLNEVALDLVMARLHKLTK